MSDLMAAYRAGWQDALQGALEQVQAVTKSPTLGQQKMIQVLRDMIEES